MDNGQSYGRDVTAGELTVEDQMESANDLRAVTDFLNTSPSETDLRKKVLAVAGMWVPAEYRTVDYLFGQDERVFVFETGSL